MYLVSCILFSASFIVHTLSCIFILRFYFCNLILLCTRAEPIPLHRSGPACSFSISQVISINGLFIENL